MKTMIVLALVNFAVVSGSDVGDGGSVSGGDGGI